MSREEEDHGSYQSRSFSVELLSKRSIVLGQVLYTYLCTYVLTSYGGRPSVRPSKQHQQFSFRLRQKNRSTKLAWLLHDRSIALSSLLLRASITGIVTKHVLVPIIHISKMGS